MPALSKVLGKGAATLVWAALFYAGMYAIVVVPTPLNCMTCLSPWQRLTCYRVEGTGAEILFYPANCLDRALFPRRWRCAPADVQVSAGSGVEPANLSDAFLRHIS
jgi:hypothetical protein